MNMYKFTFEICELEAIKKGLELYFKTLNDEENIIERNRIRGLVQTMSSCINSCTDED
jgi:hypothetical protein